MDKLMEMRGVIASLRCASDYDREPEVANGMTYAVTYTLFFFVAIAYPTSLYAAAGRDSCLQPWSTFSALLFFLTYDGLLSMQRILQRSPYDRRGDCVNVDKTLCSMEGTIFYMIRCAYDDVVVMEHGLQGGDDFERVHWKDLEAARQPSMRSLGALSV